MWVQRPIRGNALGAVSFCPGETETLLKWSAAADERSLVRDCILLVTESFHGHGNDDMTNTIETDPKDETRAETLVLQAQDAFDRAVQALQDSCKTLEQAPEAGDGDVTKAVRQMNGAFLLTMEMREKAREAGCKRFGAGGAGQLDLDAARDEIGLRLACLRRAGH